MNWMWGMNIKEEPRFDLSNWKDGVAFYPQGKTADRMSR